MFRFKQFAIRQDRCPMKVGTDGVLLGAWVSVRPSDRRILDIGTGTGLIALMMAQRVPGARITGVDVEDISQARENADASPWGGRVAFVQCPVQEFAPQGKFDLVVSNPPFFVDSLTCPDAGRTTARHAVRLPFGDLRDAVVRLLSDEGHFAVVLPADEAARFIGICRDVLLPVRRTRGAIHYHVIFFDFPYIAKEKLQNLWSHGFIKINRIDVDSKENRGRYLSKYFGKDLDLKEHKKKAFFKSQNLKVPHETKVMLTEDILHDLQKENIVFQKEYTRQIYDTNAFLSTGSCLKDSSVIYIKIKKENPCVKGESYG